LKLAPEARQGRAQIHNTPKRTHVLTKNIAKGRKVWPLQHFATDQERGATGLVKIINELIQSRKTEIYKIPGRTPQFPDRRNLVVLLCDRLQDVAGIPTQLLLSRDCESRVIDAIGTQVIPVEEETLLDRGCAGLGKSKMDQTVLHEGFNSITNDIFFSFN
jgi:hypothetical protein